MQTPPDQDASPPAPAGADPAEGEQRRSGLWGRIALLLAIGVIGLAVSALGALAVRQSLSESDRSRRAETVMAVASAIRIEVETAVRLAEATAVFLAALPEVTPADFERFAAGWPILQDPDSAARALVFVQRADADALRALVARVEAETVMGQRPSYPDFPLTPEEAGPLSLPAWMVEPAAAREGLYGVDLSADPTRLAAAAAAAGSRAARMSRPAVATDAGAPEEIASAILAPVFAADSEPVERPALPAPTPAPVGYAVVEFLPARALADVLALARQTVEDIDIAVADAGAVGEAGPLTALFESGPDVAEAEGAGPLALMELTVAGRTWRITVDPGAGTLAQSAVWLPAGVFAVGALLTAALGLLVARVHDSKALLEQRVRESTRSLRQVAEDLALSRDEAHRASAAKSEFLARMSHELRSPLTAILGFSEIIRDRLMGPLGTPVYGEYARDINASGRHLLAIVSDLLDLSKIDAGRQSVEETLIDPVVLLEEMVRLNGGTAGDAGVTLVLRRGPEGPARRLWADPRLVRQMVQNLVSNALKFTPPAGSVTLWAEDLPDGGLMLAVSDTGIGMTATQVSLARQPFTQVENVFQRTRDGAGLGLALVDGMIRLHDGRFEIDSMPGRGTIGRLIFPPERARPPAADGDAAGPPGIGRGSGPPGIDGSTGGAGRQDVGPSGDLKLIGDAAVTP